MKRVKNFISLFCATAILLLAFPVLSANFTVNISIDSNKYLVINGKAITNASVTVKVLDPFGNIDYLDQTTAGNDGTYEFKYSLAGKSEGVYTVYIYSKDLAAPISKTITYTNTQQSSSSSVSVILPSTSTSTQQQTQQQTQTQQTQQGQTSQQQQTQQVQSTVIKPQIQVVGEVAISKVDEKTLSQIVANVKTNENGEKIIQISVDTKTNVLEYEQVIPLKAVVDKNVVFDISTNIAQVKVPADIVSSSLKVENLSVNIGKISSEDLNDIKQLVGKSIEMALKVEVKADDKVLTNKDVQKPVIVKSKYVPSIGVQTKYLAVMKVAEDDKIEPIASSMYFTNNKEIAFRARDSAKYIVVENHKTFADIKNVNWAKEQIEILASRGIINGVDNNNFAPQKPITRADFLLMLVRTLELSAPVKNDSFVDVKKDDYYYDAVAIAKALGIVNGVGDGKFNPKGYITRQDMIVMADRALKVAGYKYQNGSMNINAFKDAMKISNYAKESIQKFVAEGFVQGSNNILKPADNASRAEVAVIIYRLINSYYTQQLK